MKTKLKIYAALTIALCTVLLAVSGCNLDDIQIAKGKPQLQPAGTGSIVLTVNGGNNGRTIMPRDVEFKHYIATAYEFITDDNNYAEDGLNVPLVDDGTGILKGTLNLHVGSKYKIEVDAYVDNVLEYNDGILISKPVATGEAIIGEVLASGNAPVNVTLSPVLNGAGTFSWQISPHASINKIEISIDTEPEATDFSIFDRDGTADKALVDHLILENGSYVVTFTITFVTNTGTDTRIFVEDLHIYAGLDSEYKKQFEEHKFYTMVDHLVKLFKEDRDKLHWAYFEDLTILKDDADPDELLTEIKSFFVTNPEYPENEDDLKAVVDAALVKIATKFPISGLDNAKTAVSEAALNGSNINYNGTDIDDGRTSMTATIGGKYHVTVNFFNPASVIKSIEITNKDSLNLVYLQYRHSITDLNTALGINYSNLYVEATYADDNKARLYYDSEDYEFEPALDTINFTAADEITITVKSIHLNASGQSVTDAFTVTIHPLDSITLNHTAVDKDYYQYIPATVNLDSLTVTGYWLRGMIDSEKDLEDHTIDFGVAPYTSYSGIDLDVDSAIGAPDTFRTETITASYGVSPNEKTAAFDVKVHKLTGLRLEGAHELNIAPTAAFIKDRIIRDNITVKGLYSSEPEPILNQIMVTNDPDLDNVTVNIPDTPGPHFDLTIEWKAITSEIYPIDLSSHQILDRLSVSPEVSTAKFYQYLSDFDKGAGLTITAHYTLGKQAEPITDHNQIIFTGFSNEESGEQRINISYTDGITVNGYYTINIIPLDSIEFAGVRTTYETSNPPTPAAVFAQNFTAQAVYKESGQLDHKVNIKDKLTESDIIVNSSPNTILVHWKINSNAISYNLVPLILSVSPSANTIFGTSKINDIAYGNGIHVAVGANNKIMRSVSGGNWVSSAPNLTLNPETEFFSVAYGGTPTQRFVAVGTNGRIFTSVDGDVWTQVTGHPIYEWGETVTLLSVIWTGSYFVAAGHINYYHNTNCSLVVKSENGLNWTMTANSSVGYNKIFGLASNGNYVISVGENGRATYTTNIQDAWSGQLDGKWGWMSDDIFGGSNAAYDVAYGNGTWVVVGVKGKVSWSTASNPTANADWTAVENPHPHFGERSIYSVAFGNGMFVAVGDNGHISVSADGKVWTAIPQGTGAGQSMFTDREGINRVRFDGTNFIFGGNGYGDVGNASKIVKSGG